MATKGVTGYWYKTGTIVKSSITVGPWTELLAEINGTDYQLGTVKKGSLLFEARVHKHLATAKRFDTIVPSAMAVEFRGIMEEIHRENVLLLLDRHPEESKVPAGGGGGSGILGHATLSNGLILYYAMHDNLSDPDPDRFKVTDEHTNEYHGTSYYETASINDPNGIIGDCFHLNPSQNDQITLPDISSEFSDEATLAMWLKLDNAPPLTSTHTGLCRFSTSGYPLVTAYPYTDNKFYCEIFRNSRLAGFSLAGGVDEATWHLLIISTKPGASNYNIYQNLNNILSTTGLSSVYIESVPLLGASNVSGVGSANFYDGRMGPVMLWNRNLTASERSDLFNSGAGLPYGSQGISEPEGRIQIPKPLYPAQYFTLRGKRPNAIGDEREAVEFCLYKCRMTDLIQLGSGDEVKGVRFKVKALNDSLGDYGGSIAKPYGWAHLAIEGPDPQPHPAEQDYDDDPEASWWLFDGSTDKLELPGADASGFDVGDDFTVAGYFRPDNTSQSSGIFAKWIGSPDCCWRIHQAGNNLRFSISKDGGTINFTVLAVTPPLAGGSDFFFIGRYEYVADSTSDMYFRVPPNETSNLNARGPVHQDTDTKVSIGCYESPTKFWFKGRLYWLAMWPRKLSDAEASVLEAKTTKPYELYADEIKYWDGSRVVAGTYKLNIGDEIFTVYGTPVKNG